MNLGELERSGLCKWVFVASFSTGRIVFVVSVVEGFPISSMGSFVRGLAVLGQLLLIWKLRYKLGVTSEVLLVFLSSPQFFRLFMVLLILL